MLKGYQKTKTWIFNLSWMRRRSLEICFFLFFGTLTSFFWFLIVFVLVVGYTFGFLNLFLKTQ